MAYLLVYSLASLRRGKPLASVAGDRIMSAADLGKVIRARRKELGYTQVEVA